MSQPGSNDADGALAPLQQEMDQYLAHQRRRLRLIAVVVALMAMVLAVGHALDDAEGSSLVPLGLDDLFAGYPIMFAMGLIARLVWLRARAYNTVPRRSRIGGRRQ